MKPSKHSRQDIDISRDFQRSQQSIQKSSNTPRKKSPSPITLRLNEDERARLKHLSQGMTVSAYIRKCLFQDNATRRKRRSYRPVEDQASLAKALALLGQSRIANNLNQLAHHANMGSLSVDEKTLIKIDEAYEHVNSLRDELVRALGLLENR